MNAMMIHRGPDDAGAYVDRSGIALGVRRLSIIDVQGGHQPVSNEDGTIWAVLNGEIYNHTALFEQLRRAGHEFSSRTDTEVLVHLYEEYGDDLVDVLEGMYAFAVWDVRRRRLLLGRDRFAEKPLFFRATERRLVFASELSALRRGLADRADEIDPTSLAAFLDLGYVPGPRSLLLDIEQLPPAHRLTWSADHGRVRIERYWRLPRARSASRSSTALMEELDTGFARAVRSRLIADVPVGVLLSGGVDSTLVAAYAARASAKQIRTFTVGYEVGDVNETHRARHVAEIIGSDHREVILTQQDVARRVPALLAALDQPLGDPALVALHCVCEFAREYVTVAVGGEGADELFAGYPRYRWLALSSRLGASAVPAALLEAGARTMRRTMPAGRARRVSEILQPGPVVDRHIGWVTDGAIASMRTLWGPALRAARPDFDAAADARAVIARSGEMTTLGQFMALDQERWLPDDVLAKADRASMLASLEMRTPFLERGIAELASSAAISTLAGRRDKHLLRTLLERALPELGGSPPKAAFRVPLGQWLRGPLRPLVNSQLAEGRAFAEGWLDRAAVQRLVDDHDACRRDCSRPLWTVVVFGAWLDELRASAA